MYYHEKLFFSKLQKRAEKRYKKDLLRCLGFQSRDTYVFRHSFMSSSRRYTQKHKQCAENNLMQ